MLTTVDREPEWEWHLVGVWRVELCVRESKGKQVLSAFVSERKMKSSSALEVQFWKKNITCSGKSNKSFGIVCYSINKKKTNCYNGRKFSVFLINFGSEI